VWTVRATATVATNATAITAAESNFVFRDTILVPRDSVASYTGGVSKNIALHKITGGHI
jgi:hypothetical protein